MKVLLTATVQSHIAQFHMPLIRMLKENGYEVHVAARNNLEEKNGLKLEGVDKIFDIPFKRSPLDNENIKAFIELKKILTKNRYEFIHCNTPMGGVITRIAAKNVRKDGTKVIYTAHGFHFYKGSPLKNWLIYYPIEKYLAKYTDRLITITKEDQKLALKKFNTKVFYTHGVGVDSKRYYSYSKSKVENIREELGYINGDFLILCTGELNKNKNQEIVIRAVANSTSKVPNVKLLLAGNGDMDKSLKELVKELNLEKHVKFLGYRTDLEKYVNASDMCVSASLREGLPLNIVEAMLCKKTVLASINRGHKELIQDGVTGYLVHHDDVAGFSEKIVTLSQNPSMLINLSNLASKAASPFKNECVLKELKEIYEF